MKLCIARGLKGKKLIIGDDNTGLQAARKAFFTGITLLHCLFSLHLIVLSYFPHKSMQSEVSEEICLVSYAPNRETAGDNLIKVGKKIMVKNLSTLLNDNHIKLNWIAIGN